MLQMPQVTDARWNLGARADVLHPTVGFKAHDIPAGGAGLLIVTAIVRVLRTIERYVCWHRRVVVGQRWG